MGSFKVELSKPIELVKLLKLLKLLKPLKLIRLTEVGSQDAMHLAKEGFRQALPT